VSRLDVEEKVRLTTSVKARVLLCAGLALNESLKIPRAKSTITALPRFLLFCILSQLRIAKFDVHFVKREKKEESGASRGLLPQVIGNSKAQTPRLPRTPFILFQGTF